MPDRLIPPAGASRDEVEVWAAEARARRAEDIRAAEQFRRAVWRRGLLEICIVEWAAVALMLWSFHTADQFAGTVAFWSALGLGDGGFLVLFVRTWRRAEGGSPT